MLSDLYFRIYILPYHQLFGVCLCALLLFWELRRRFGVRRWWKPVLGCVLLAWAAVILWTTVLSRDGGNASGWALMPFHSYREVLAGGNPELLRSNLMNVVLFVPAGVLTAALLPDDCQGKTALLWVACVFGLFSLGIEWVQFSRGLGQAEMDDVIHNVLGAAAGSILSKSVPLLFHKEHLL